MILYHKGLSICPELFHFKKKVALSDNFSFIPINYNNKDLVIQTPDMLIPFGIQTFNGSNHNYLNLSYQCNKVTDNFLKILDNIYDIVYQKYHRKYFINSFIKDNNILKSKMMRFKVIKGSLFFNQNKEKIKEKDIKDIRNTWGVFIINLSGLWIINGNIWFNWNILQSQFYIPLALDTFSFFEEKKKSIIPPPPPPPPPPPLPTPSSVIKIKSSLKKDKKRINDKENKDKFIPSINEIQLALSLLNKIE